MGKNGLSRLRWLGVTAPEARNPAEAGPPFLTTLLAPCGSAAPVAPGARRPERSRWRCGAPAEHGEASPPSDHCRLALFVPRAGPLLSRGTAGGHAPPMTLDAGRG